MTINKYDLCIVGAGPAGIITGLEFNKLNPLKKICIIEYGLPDQNEKNKLDDSIKLTNKVNHHDPYECTNKGLGGSSQTWGGRCVMFDEIDFIDRPIVNNGCTWDLTLFEEVKKYLPRTSEYFECGESIFNLSNHPELKGTTITPNFKQGDVTDTTIERWSKPTNFGKRYRDEIISNKNITLLEGYEARDLESDKAGNILLLKATHSVSGEQIEIKADQYILAAGTQETTRILLRNKNVFASLNNIPDALGKYYQGHVSGKIASVKFYGDPKKTDYYFLKDKDGIYLRRRFQFTAEFLQKNNLLNTAIWLDNPLYYNYRHRSGAMSFMYLAMVTPVLGKKLAPPAIAHSITNGKKENIGQHFWNVFKDLPGSLVKPATIFYNRYCKDRKLPGIFLYSPKNTYALHFHAEQVPFEGNTMTLDADGETLIINYQLTDDDVDSVIKLHQALDKQLRDSNCGELIYWYPEDELANKIREISSDGIHQSGTTRISKNPEMGVVDENLKVWGTRNLYVCSSSVFPTSGQANPTFFLGAFAVRLAKYISDNEKN